MPATLGELSEQLVRTHCVLRQRAVCWMWIKQIPKRWTGPNSEVNVIPRRQTTSGFRIDAEATAIWRSWRQSLPAEHACWQRAVVYIRLKGRAPEIRFRAQLAQCLSAASTRRLAVDRRDVIIEIEPGNAFEGALDAGGAGRLSTVVIPSPPHMTARTALASLTARMSAGTSVLFADGSGELNAVADNDELSWWPRLMEFEASARAGSRKQGAALAALQRNAKKRAQADLLTRDAATQNLGAKDDETK